jgi:RNA-directed DNA polymerase
MKESYRKGVANHPDPESCGITSNGEAEALTGVHTGSVSSRENGITSAPTPLVPAEGNTGSSDTREHELGTARSKTRYMCGNSMRENREALQFTGKDGTQVRLTKGNPQTVNMHDCRESHRGVVPTNDLNKEVQTSAEDQEGRPLTKRNSNRTPTLRTQCRESVSGGLDRVRAVAQRNRSVKFTALLHHVTVESLKVSYMRLNKDACAGTDGETWKEYQEHLEENIKVLHQKVHSGAYRASPSLRTFIPKSDGRQRPLGITALEDKIVQGAVVKVMNAVYEADFLGFSYGFRSGRSQHRALDALWVGISTRNVNYVLDADIRGFFDTINHDWLMRFIEHRIADRRILRLIRKWLKAGVLEEGKWVETEVGTPQGSVISPLLANIYLHYVLDLWVNQWREKGARGEVVIVRYCDDFVMGFQYWHDAKAFLPQLRERMRRFGLELHSDKTRLIEFGRYAISNRMKRGAGKPETFNFLGFTHISSQTPKCRFVIKRKTIRKRLSAKLAEVKDDLTKRMHEPVPIVGKWLSSVIRGYDNYHSIPGNMRCLETFRRAICRYWLHTLRRRSERGRMTWERFNEICMPMLPKARILHPYPNVRFNARYSR